MPTSAPGSSRPHRALRSARRGLRRLGAGLQRGFTLIELIIVIAVVAVSVGLMTLALRDGDATRLEEEAARLTALLEMARAEARVSGSTVRWLPTADSAEAHFRFVGLSLQQHFPTRWLDANVRAQVSDGVFVVLGPEAILPAQRIVLRLGQQRLDVASDGLGPFAVAEPPR